MSEIKVYGTPAADTTKPVAQAPTVALLDGATLGTNAATALPARISWPGRLGRHHADRRPPLSPAGERGRRRVHQRDEFSQGGERQGPPLATGSAYRYRVQVRDAAGNTSTAAAGPTLHTELREEDTASIHTSARGSRGWLAPTPPAVSCGRRPPSGPMPRTPSAPATWPW